MWTLFFFVVFISGTVTAALVEIPDDAWVTWWSVKVSLAIAVGIAATVWFLIAGIGDLIKMIKTLRAAVVDETDDGWVPREKHLQKDT